MRTQFILFDVASLNILECVECFRSHFQINLHSSEVMSYVRAFDDMASLVTLPISRGLL